LFEAREYNIPEGYMSICEDVVIRNGCLECHPTFSAAAIINDGSRMHWMTGNETLTNLIEREDQTGGYFICSKERLSGAADGYNNHTICSPSVYLGSGAISISGTALTGSVAAYFTEDCCTGTKIWVVDNAEWVTILNVTDDQTATLTASATAATDSTYYIAQRNLLPRNPDGTSACVRYTWVNGYLVVVGDKATYFTTDNTLSRAAGYSALEVLRYDIRGSDVVTLAGRPVLLGAGKNITYGGVGSISNMLCWPTRSDITNWDGYGSGFLYTLDDGGYHYAGANLGDDAYVFSRATAYRLYATGMSASNPIAYKRLRIQPYRAPLSNAVVGEKGIYYWSGEGLVRFDGHKLELLWKSLGYDPEMTLTIRPVLFYNSMLRTIHMASAANPSSWRLIYSEDNEAFYRVSMAFDSLGCTSTDAYNYMLRPITLTTSTQTIMRAYDAGTDINLVGSGSNTGYVTWRGITGPASAGINKVARALRVVYSGTGTIEASLGPSGSGQAAAALETSPPVGDIGVATLTGGSNLYRYEAPVWEVILEFDSGMKIYEVLVDFQIAGETGVEITSTTNYILCSKGVVTLQALQPTIYPNVVSATKGAVTVSAQAVTIKT
jgi:hypothetical protein